MNHGESKTRLYSIWKTMKKRCNYEKAADYQYYGGRGIQVCPEWNQSFAVFRDWSYSHGYQDTLTIDRIDCDGNYEPKNCRWVDMKTQANNRRPIRRGKPLLTLTVGNTTKPLKFWAELTGIRYDVLFHRSKNSNSLDILFDPDSRVRFNRFHSVDKKED